MTYQLLAVLFSGLLVACQNSSSGGGSSAPNDKAKQSEEGDKNGSSDDGDEIAIVRLVDDLGECNKSRRGKSYYVLADKKFRYCGDSDQWDVVDLKGSAGASGEAGKTSLVAVTSESAGGNCAAGGQKIQSGLDANGNGQLDASEVTSTSFACNGLVGATGAAGAAGANGAAGSNGKPSLVAVTAEAAGSNCASGGHKVRSGLDSNSSGVLDDSEVQSTSFVCHGGTGAQGSAGTSGKNALIKTSAEASGVNCANGGKKLEYGVDTDGNGVLAVGEVTGTSYVCNGATGAAGAAGADGADGDRYVGRVMYTSNGTRLGVIVKELDFLTSTSTPPLSNTWATPDRLLVVHDATNNRHVGYVASSKTDLVQGGGYTQVTFRTRKLEDAQLTKLSTFSVPIVYSNSSCNSSGAYFAYNMTQSYKPNSGGRYFNNKVLQDYLAGLGLTIVYNLNSTNDIIPNCTSPTLRTDIGSHDGWGSCETLCRDPDVGCSYPATGYVCTFSSVANVFPDGIAAGWYVLKN